MARALTVKQRDLLGLLREGVSQTQACRATGVKRATFYNWKAKDPDFRGAVEIAIKEGEHRLKRMESIPDPGDKPLDKAWKDQFLVLYIESKGVMGDACEAVGVRIDDVLDCLDPNSDSYDHDFDRMFQRAKRVVDQKVEDSILRNITKPGQNNSLVTAKWWLERRRPEEFSSKSSLYIENNQAPPQISAAEVKELLVSLLRPAPKEPPVDVAFEPVEEPRQLVERTA